MALSNWDTMAINLKGEPVNGSFTTPMGVSVEFYKNWLYIRDEKAWRPDGPYTGNVVMSVQSGDFEYQDLEVRAIRGPQNGVYAACRVRLGKDPDGMVGCGVYGFRESEWVGVEEPSLQFLKDWLSKKERVFDEEQAKEFLKQFTPESREKIEESLKEEIFVLGEEFGNVPLDKVLRFNQGDAYIADKLGKTFTPGTKVGEQAEPLLIQALKNKVDE